MVCGSMLLSFCKRHLKAMLYLAFAFPFAGMVASVILANGSPNNPLGTFFGTLFALEVAAAFVFMCVQNFRKGMRGVTPGAAK
jgi:hypothetical protein